MARVLGDLMKRETQRHGFLSTLQFPPWYKSSFLEKEEKRGSKSEDSDEGGSDSEESVCVELYPVFKIGNVALHYICVDGIYQPATATKNSAHTSVLEMAVVFWRSGSS